MKLSEFLEQIDRAVEANPDILDKDIYLRVGPSILEVNIKGGTLDRSN